MCRISLLLVCFVIFFTQSYGQKTIKPNHVKYSVLFITTDSSQINYNVSESLELKLYREDLGTFI